MIFSRNAGKRHVQILSLIQFVLLSIAIIALAINTNGGADEPSPDFYGEPVQLSTLPAASPAHFDQRTGCRISRFGVAPWRFTREVKDAQWSQMTYAAMRAAGLPDDAAFKAVAMMQNGKPDETLGMGDTYGQAHTSGMYFLPRYDTTYRMGNRYTACTDSVTSFKNDRQESATVYRVSHEGKVYFVGEFLACGNVTRFYPAPPGWYPPQQQRAITVPILPPQETPTGPGATYPSPELPWWRGGNPGQPAVPIKPPVVHEVPEPGTLALVGAAVGVLIWMRRK